LTNTRFLELAVNGGADLIVSGDADLLALDPFRGIPIVTPSPFLQRAGGEWRGVPLVAPYIVGSGAGRARRPIE